MLYLIASPIGNLGDFSLRAIETIKQCDYLLCEDTRRTGILLKHYQLSKPMKSFHMFNEKAKEARIIDDLQSGKTIGLLSDAGTPGISDPGAKLVEKCRTLNLDVIPIPGACAAIAALSASGLDTTRFQFFGFLPKKKGKLRQTLTEILVYRGTTICYESPYRLLPTLKIVLELDPDRLCVIAREITKKFETFVRGNAEELIQKFSNSPPKGEIVILISGCYTPVSKRSKKESYDV